MILDLTIGPLSCADAVRLARTYRLAPFVTPSRNEIEIDLLTPTVPDLVGLVDSQARHWHLSVFGTGATDAEGVRRAAAEFSRSPQALRIARSIHFTAIPLAASGSVRVELAGPDRTGDASVSLRSGPISIPVGPRQVWDPMPDDDPLDQALRAAAAAQGVPTEPPSTRGSFRRVVGPVDLADALAVAAEVVGTRRVWHPHQWTMTSAALEDVRETLRATRSAFDATGAGPWNVSFTYGGRYKPDDLERAFEIADRLTCELGDLHHPDGELIDVTVSYDADGSGTRETTVDSPVTIQARWVDPGERTVGDPPEPRSVDVARIEASMWTAVRETFGEDVPVHQYGGRSLVSRLAFGDVSSPL